MPMRDCIEMVEKLGNSTMAKLLETHLETFLDLYKKTREISLVLTLERTKIGLRPNSKC